jgi:hypothetical protein
MAPPYTPELVASVRDAYEHDPGKSVPQIAREHGMSERALYRMSEREGWVRRAARPHDVPRAARLLQQANALAKLQTAPPVPALPEPPAATEDAGAAMLPEAAAIEHIARLVEQEIAAEQSVRTRLGLGARAPADAARCARTLLTLTQTLETLRRLRADMTHSGFDDDDMPEDIDAFRTELARRINAFMESRTEQARAAGELETCPTCGHEWITTEAPDGAPRAHETAEPMPAAEPVTALEPGQPGHAGPRITML